MGATRIAGLRSYDPQDPFKQPSRLPTLFQTGAECMRLMPRIALGPSQL